MAIPTSRKFNGKTFRVGRAWSRKANANKAAKRHRATGASARVVRHNQPALGRRKPRPLYVVYTRN